MQDFATAIPINDNDTFVRDNFALQVHEIEAVDESTMIVLPQVFVADLGDISQLEVAGGNITEDDLQTFDDESDIEGQPTAFANLPTTVFQRAISQLSGNDTALRVCYTVFFDDVLFQLRSTLRAGALTNLGIRCQVTAEVTTMPACELPHLPTIMPVHRAPFQIT